MAKTLGIVGPLIAMVGALILILDAVRNLTLWTEFVEWPVERFKTMTAQHRRFSKRIQEYPPNYPYEERQKEIEHELDRYDEEIYKDQKNMAQQQLKERKSSVKRALWGFALIAIGSLMQSGAALFAK